MTLFSHKLILREIKPGNRAARNVKSQSLVLLSVWVVRNVSQYNRAEIWLALAGRYDMVGLVTFILADLSFIKTGDNITR